MPIRVRMMIAQSKPATASPTASTTTKYWVGKSGYYLDRTGENFRQRHTQGHRAENDQSQFICHQHDTEGDKHLVEMAASIKPTEETVFEPNTDQCGNHQRSDDTEQGARARGALRELLTMSANWYWKLDDQLRFVHFQPPDGMDLDAPADELLGLTPWELDDFGLDDDEMDALRADLESRQPFGKLLLRRKDASGRLRASSAAAAGRASPPAAPSAVSGASGATSPPRWRHRTRSAPVKRAASCSSARRRRSCCTAPAACSTPTRPQPRCAAWTTRRG